MQIPVLLAGVSAVSGLNHPTLPVEGLFGTNMQQPIVSYQALLDALSSADVPLSAEEVEAQKVAIAPLGMSGVTVACTFFLLVRANLLRAVDAGSHVVAFLTATPLSPQRTAGMKVRSLTSSRMQ